MNTLTTIRGAQARTPLHRARALVSEALQRPAQRARGVVDRFTHELKERVSTLPHRMALPAVARTMADFGVLAPASGDLTRLSDIAYHLNKAQRIILTTHVNPDADGLASMLALGCALEKQGKEVELIVDGRVPHRYSALPGFEKIKYRNSNPNAVYDLGILLDSGDVRRSSQIFRDLVATGNIPQTLCLDHHASEEYTTDIVYSNTRAAATGEIIFRLMREMGMPLNNFIATNLYASIMGDTLGFRSPATSMQTHLIISELMKFGVEHTSLYQKIFESKTWGKFELFSRARASVQRSSDGSMAWMTVTSQDFHDTETHLDDSAPFVDTIKTIHGIEVAVIFIELPDGRIKVSFRSNGENYNVGEIAQAFGGGGHAHMSGFVTSEPTNVESVKQEVLEYLLDLNQPELLAAK
jgi:bifunctional oligoribonuclease and PAP phosphatase NrnA